MDIIFVNRFHVSVLRIMLRHIPSEKMLLLVWCSRECSDRVRLDRCKWKVKRPLMTAAHTLQPNQNPSDTSIRIRWTWGKEEGETYELKIRLNGQVLSVFAFFLRHFARLNCCCAKSMCAYAAVVFCFHSFGRFTLAIHTPDANDLRFGKFCT